MSYNEGFASVYDLFFTEEERRERAAYYLALLAGAGVDGGILLDLGCGTGAMIPYYLRAGFDVIAADISPEMLTLAREKLSTGKDRVLFLCQGMRALDLYGTVKATVASLDAVNHLLTEADLLAAFKRVALFTEPGGVFVFDMNTPFKHRESLGDSTFVFEEAGAYLVWQNELDADTDTVEMFLDIFTRGEDGRYSRSSDTVTERAYPADSVAALLKEAGFDSVSVYGDLTFEAPGQFEERVCFAALRSQKG